MVVLPNWSLCIEKEIFVVAENVSDHHTDETKEEILRAWPCHPLQLLGTIRHSRLLD
jgi:hypothetical protein